jgi:hypothetical protein
MSLLMSTLIVGSKDWARMTQVIIGVDPHERSATIEIINQRAQVLRQGRLGTDRDGYQAMLAAGRKHADRVWAVEGCNGIGRHVARRLITDGETVVDVPAKLSARAQHYPRYLPTPSATWAVTRPGGPDRRPQGQHPIGYAGRHSSGATAAHQPTSVADAVTPPDVISWPVRR